MDWQRNDFITPPAAARIADVTPQTATRWCRSIPGLAVRVAGRWRVDPAALDRVLAGQLGLGGEDGKRPA